MNSGLSRREFVKGAACAAVVAGAWPAWRAFAEPAASRPKMRLAFSPGAIGRRAGPREAIILAHKHGFEAVEPSAGFLAGLSAAELADFKADLEAKGLTLAAAGLPVEFRGDEAKFRSSLESFQRQAAVLQQAGVDRVGTWISPTHNDLTYLENFRLHARRLRETAQVLKDHHQRLGLEYVGTPTARQGHRFPFIHCMKEMRELISEIGTGNVGFVLDSWHWWTAGETEADLLSLQSTDVISVDLNDAPAGIPLERQQDGKRELPCATGVIPIGTFLGALNRIGYDGPARAEPFNQPLNKMDDEEACAATITALRKAIALVR
jgi:sugar phosphate isomerase/epimerase